MPDASAGAGRLALTFCTANGDLVNLLTTASDHDDPGGQANGLDCPYGMSVVQDLLVSPMAMTLAISLYHRDIVMPAYRALPALPALGPPLGSRAPPYLG